MRKMLKISLITLLLVLSMSLVGCNSKNEKDIYFEPNFEVVCKHGTSAKGYVIYLVDKDTERMYVYTECYSQSTMCPYIAYNGEVMSYYEFNRDHTQKYHSEN